MRDYSGHILTRSSIAKNFLPSSASLFVRTMQGVLRRLEVDLLLPIAQSKRLLTEAHRMHIDTGSSWHRLQEKLEPERRSSPKGAWIMKSPLGKYAAAAATAAVVIGSFSFSPVRAIASEFLEIFRANKIETIYRNARRHEQIREAMRLGRSAKAGEYRELR